jgi:hypothetical protein
MKTKRKRVRQTNKQRDRDRVCERFLTAHASARYLCRQVGMADLANHLIPIFWDLQGAHERLVAREANRLPHRVIKRDSFDIIGVFTACHSAENQTPHQYDQRVLRVFAGAPIAAQILFAPAPHPVSDRPTICSCAFFVRQSAGVGLISSGETYGYLFDHFGGGRGFGFRGLSNVARGLRIRTLPSRAFQRRV